jgi:hypothetical protein
MNKPQTLLLAVAIRLLGLSIGGSVFAADAEPAQQPWRVRDIAADGDGVVWGIAERAPTTASVHEIGGLARYDAETQQWT